MVYQSTIKYSNEYKYLGIYFNEFLNTTQIIDHAATSARKTLAGIIACSKMLGGLKYKSYTQLCTYNRLWLCLMGPFRASTFVDDSKECNEIFHGML